MTDQTTEPEPAEPDDTLDIAALAVRERARFRLMKAETGSAKPPSERSDSVTVAKV